MTEPDLKLSVNAFSYYLSCEEGLNSYPSLKDYLVGEEQLLELFSKQCLLLNRNDIYLKLIEKVTKFYYDEDEKRNSLG